MRAWVLSASVRPLDQNQTLHRCAWPLGQHECLGLRALGLCDLMNAIGFRDVVWILPVCLEGAKGKIPHPSHIPLLLRMVGTYAARKSLSQRACRKPRNSVPSLCRRLPVCFLHFFTAIQVVVNVMVPFWVPIIIRHLIFRIPTKGP